jgi:hypothetical protein
MRTASLPSGPIGVPQPTNQIQPGMRSASLPDRTPQEPIPLTGSDRFLAGKRTYAPRFSGRHRFQDFPIGFGYVAPMYDYAEGDARREIVQTGYLHLDLQPGSASVYVDGYYTGTVDDFRRLIPGRALDSGPHKVEIRAAGYESASFDVIIAPRETITYRADLKSTSSAVRPVAAPPVAKTFYVIPGCYAGDKPPRTAPLPKGCDASKMRAIPPTVSTVARVQR